MHSTIYNFDISNQVYQANINRLTNQVWKLIPMKENNENWLLQLDSVILELVGLSNLLAEHNKYIVLLSKLEGLKNENIGFELYRKTVFESISLLREI